MSDRDDAGIQQMVITPSVEFGQGDHYHRPAGEDEQAIAACRGDMFPEGTRYMAADRAESWGYTPCRHPACFGGEDGAD
ncbi:MAG: hypothetical protein ABEJ55_07665 [Halanaeroarchaeum sp.]